MLRYATGRILGEQLLAKRKLVWLSATETEALVKVAKSQSQRDYLILMLCRYGLRDGEILGRGRLPGIYVHDLRENGIWLVGKGYTDDPPSLYPLPHAFMQELVAFSTQLGRGKERKLFDLGVRQLERVVKQYAEMARILDWKDVGPHRLRAFFATDLDERGYSAFTIRNMMRHSSITTTNRYVGRGTIERRSGIMERLV